ncbi:DUF4181 domain-containing protein [Bacillus carboniphilus]
MFITAVKFVLRKTLNIKKNEKKFFSYNHINKLHKKIDLTFRTCSLIAFIILFYYILNSEFSINYFFIALVIFTGIEYVVQAFFEWRYTDNPKHSILTLSEMVVIITTLIIIFQFDLLSKFS